MSGDAPSSPPGGNDGGRPGRQSRGVSGSPPGVRRARRVAGWLHGLAYLMMHLAVWGAPVRVVQVVMRAPGPAWSPWHVWAMAEWTVACLVAAYLLWSAAEVVRDPSRH